ncbi:unnamed protein product [Caenorhabditis bovis]|uniref:Uncharacterized protein n=1 Tax=Caenorhabditis bovis TaxID=2654633 RepID=A0A8S1F3B3_9PELO|nr:unnamed protein product [Caenorhabditis bovis]
MNRGNPKYGRRQKRNNKRKNSKINLRKRSLERIKENDSKEKVEVEENIVIQENNDVVEAKNRDVPASPVIEEKAAEVEVSEDVALTEIDGPPNLEMPSFRTPPSSVFFTYNPPSSFTPYPPPPPPLPPVHQSPQQFQYFPSVQRQPQYFQPLPQQHYVPIKNEADEFVAIDIKESIINMEKRDASLYFEKMFGGFLTGINPLYRLGCDVKLCDTFDGEEIRNVFDKLIAVGLRNAWPFDDPTLVVTDDELRRIFTSIYAEVKVCFFVAGLQRGYMCKMMYQKTLNEEYFNGIDVIKELKFFDAICKKIATKFPKIDELGIDKDCRKVFDLLLPNLLEFNTEVLYANGVNDELASLCDRKSNGFEVSESDIDEMLEWSLKEKGFGDFPPTAYNYPELFTTRKQFDKYVEANPVAIPLDIYDYRIFEVLDIMQAVTDIRVKISAARAITNILKCLSPEERNEIFTLHKDARKFTMSSMLGCEAVKFEVEPLVENRCKYFKMFYPILGVEKPNENSEIDPFDLSFVLMYLYMKHITVEVNHIIFKLLSLKLNKSTENDIKAVRQAIHLLPDSLKSHLELCQPYSEGDESREVPMTSMYFQVLHVLRTEKEERIFPKFCTFLKNLIRDLALLALQKYTIPDEKFQTEKYDFISYILKQCFHICHTNKITLDIEDFLEKWKALNHPWFVMANLTYAESFCYMLDYPIQYPWKNDHWDEKTEESEKTDAKKYARVVEVLTAWPINAVGQKNTSKKNKSFLAYIVKHVVPENVDRAELYNAMDEFVGKMTVRETLKPVLYNEINKARSYTNGNEYVMSEDIASNEEAESQENSQECEIVEEDETQKEVTEDEEEKEQKKKEISTNEEENEASFYLTLKDLTDSKPDEVEALESEDSKPKIEGEQISEPEVVEIEEQPEEKHDKQPTEEGSSE